MRKEQLIRICLAMLLASTTIMLSSCKKDPKDKDPKVALVNTHWQILSDLMGEDLSDLIGEGVGDLRFTSQTEGELTVATKGMKLTFSLTYSYDATQKAYPAMVKMEDITHHFIMKVNWDTNILLLYEQKDGAVSPIPELSFRLVK